MPFWVTIPLPDRWLRFFVRRIFAPVFIAVSSLGVLLTIPDLFPGHVINVNGMPTSNYGWRLFAVGFNLFNVVVGVVLYRIKPTRHLGSTTDG